MSVLSDFRSRLINWLMDGLEEVYRKRGEDVATRRDYYAGVQPRQLKVRQGQMNDNLVVNFCRLVVNRSVTMLFGKGIEFDLPNGDESPEADYLSAVWDANRQQILLHNVALFGAMAGTCYLRIIPGAAFKADVAYPRLVALDPMYVIMDTNPEDIEQVIRYTIRFNVRGPDGKEVARKTVIETGDGAVDAAGMTATYWTITDYVSTPQGRWQVIGQETWEYDFPPVIHWQNLPDPGSQYGLPDVTDDVIELQDRVNFLASNISKLIRLYAHPARYGIMAGQAGKIDLGPDEMPNFNSKDSEIRQMDALGDLAAAHEFTRYLEKSLFDITQTVDLSSQQDKLGALTNFAVRVLYSDALAKLGTKQELYGDAIKELNRRLLVLNGMDGAEPGEIVWPDPLPVNELEKLQALQIELGLGIVSKETAAIERGRDWEQEQERISDDQAAGDNVGAAILRAFERGEPGNQPAGRIEQRQPQRQEL